MASKLFVPGTVIDSPWLNTVDTSTYSYLTAVAGTNAITATGPISMLSYTAGDRFYLKPAITNTGATTINISGLGVQPITKNGSSNLVAGDLVVGHVYEIVYDGSLFQLINPSTVNLEQVIPVTNGGTGGTTPIIARTNLGFTTANIDRSYASYNGTTGFTALIPRDNTIPQNTEGSQLLTASITPKSVANRVRVRFSAWGACNPAPNDIIIALFIGSGVNAVQVCAVTPTVTDATQQVCLEYESVPGVTTPTIYSIRVGLGTAGTLVFNGNTGTPLFGGAASATLILEEIAV